MGGGPEGQRGLQHPPQWWGRGGAGVVSGPAQAWSQGRTLPGTSRGSALGSRQQEGADAKEAIPLHPGKIAGWSGQGGRLPPCSWEMLLAGVAAGEASVAIHKHRRRRTWTNTLTRGRTDGGLVGWKSQLPPEWAETAIRGCKKRHCKSDLTLRIDGGGGAFKIILSNPFFVKIRSPNPRKGQ